MKTIDDQKKKLVYWLFYDMGRYGDFCWPFFRWLAVRLAVFFKDSSRRPTPNWLNHFLWNQNTYGKCRACKRIAIPRSKHKVCRQRLRRYDAEQRRHRLHRERELIEMNAACSLPSFSGERVG